MRHVMIIVTSVFIVGFFSGCATHTPKQRASLPEHIRSILILPPKNDSIEVGASYALLSVLSHPIAEQGYYVFPVAVIDTFLKENGLPSPNEMHNVALDKLHENTGADAVLYAVINNWGQKYQVISSSTVIDARLKLVDARNGSTLWQTSIKVSQQSNNNHSSGLAGLLVGAIVDQVVNSISDKTRGLAKYEAEQQIRYSRQGLLPGPYAPRPNSDGQTPSNKEQL